MSFKTLLLLLVQQLALTATAQETITPVVIAKNGTGSCASAEELQNAYRTIFERVKSVLSRRIIPQCGDGLWKQVAHLNMSDPLEHCPSEWREYNSNGVRACGRPLSLVGTCPGTFYPSGTEYSRICGRIIGYQVGSPAAFVPARDLRPTDFLDGIYVDGVSVTHGSPRSHIWTFAAGTTEGRDPNVIVNCPCLYNPDRANVVLAPSSIRNSSYCESGNDGAGYTAGYLYASDPLWDGEQCEGQCCSGNGQSPPWFSVTLPTPTRDDIEVRVCGNQDTHDEDNPVSLLEFYVQ